MAIRRIMKELRTQGEAQESQEAWLMQGRDCLARPERYRERLPQPAGQTRSGWLNMREFPHHDGKVHLSLLIDCFDRMPVAWTVGTSPAAELANTSSEKGMATLHEEEHPKLSIQTGADRLERGEPGRVHGGA